MITKEVAEEVLCNIVKRAEELGDEVLHSYVMDLQDGTFNVKAIIKFKDGKCKTVGANIG